MQQWIVLEAGKDKLAIQAQHVDAAISLQLAVHHAPEVIALPASALEEVQGREGIVTWERHSERVIARWDEAGIPRVVEYGTTDPAKLPPFPPLPSSFVTNPPAFIKALDDAMHSTAVDSVRYATGKVQLRGSGEIVATDGKQLLMQKGFKFPWEDNVLVARMMLFGAGVLPDDTPVKIGRVAKHVVIQAGEWTIALAIDTEGRYPNVEQVIPKGNSTTWTLSLADASAVLRHLPKLPGVKDDNSPVTVDLNGKIAVRAKGDQSKPVELLLEGSKITGPPVKFSTNRALLARALQLGFREIQIVNGDTPLMCRDGQRLFIWMPLPKESCIAAHPDAIIIRGSQGNPPSTSKPERRKPAPRGRMNAKLVPIAKAEPAPVKPVEQPPVKSAGLGALIDEAREMRAAMQGMFARSKNLIAALQLHRRKARIVDSTLASLKKLQNKVK